MHPALAAVEVVPCALHLPGRRGVWRLARRARASTPESCKGARRGRPPPTTGGAKGSLSIFEAANEDLGGLPRDEPLHRRARKPRLSAALRRGVSRPHVEGRRTCPARQPRSAMASVTTLRGPGGRGRELEELHCGHTRDDPHHHLSRHRTEHARDPSRGPGRISRVALRGASGTLLDAHPVVDEPRLEGAAPPVLRAREGTASRPTTRGQRVAAACRALSLAVRAIAIEPVITAPSSRSRIATARWPLSAWTSARSRAVTAVSTT